MGPRSGAEEEAATVAASSAPVPQPGSTPIMKLSPSATGASLQRVVKPKHKSAPGVPGQGPYVPGTGFFTDSAIGIIHRPALQRE